MTIASACAFALAIGSASIGAFVLYGLVLPREFIARLRTFVADFGSRGAVAVRVVLAALLWLSAPVSATPAAFRTMAVVILVAALVPLMLGTDGLLKLIDRLGGGPPFVTRLTCAAGLAFCAFMLWSVVPAIGTF